MKINKGFKIKLIYFIVFLLGCAIAPYITSRGIFDRNCIFNWTNFAQHFGVQNIYKIKAEYPPFLYYFMWIYGKLNRTPENIYLNIYQFKYLVFFTEIVSLFVVYRILKFRNIKYAAYLPFFILINIAFWYNTFLFGQIDGMVAGLAFISVAFGVFKKPSLSLLFYVICLNLKFQSIIFFPIIIILIFKELSSSSLKKSLFAFLPAILFQVLILLPFIITNQLELVLEAFYESFGRYPFVSMGAYNIWSLVFENPISINDNSGAFGFSYNSMGLICFFGLSAMVLFPLAISCLNLFKSYFAIDFSFENILLVSVLIILFFFYFNTQMHARYSHPLIIFSGTLAILRKDYIRFLLVSLAVFLNVEGAFKMLKSNIEEYQFFWFQPWFVSALFLIVIILYGYDFFVLIKKSIKFELNTNLKIQKRKISF